MNPLIKIRNMDELKKRRLIKKGEILFVGAIWMSLFALIAALEVKQAKEHPAEENLNREHFRHYPTQGKFY